MISFLLSSLILLWLTTATIATLGLSTAAINIIATLRHTNSTFHTSRGQKTTAGSHHHHHLLCNDVASWPDLLSLSSPSCFNNNDDEDDRYNRIFRVRGGADSGLIETTPITATTVTTTTHQNEVGSDEPEKLHPDVDEYKLVSDQIEDTFNKSRLSNEEQEENNQQLQWNMTSLRDRFLERIRIVSQSLWREPEAMVITDSTEAESTTTVSPTSMIIDSPPSDDGITPASDLSLPNRYITIVTTAALPWMTGTAVNPLLRAAYLFRYTQHVNRRRDVDETKEEPPSMEPNQGGYILQTSSYVRLVVPWLELEEDRRMLYGDDHLFASPVEQEAHIREWLRDEAHMPDAAEKLIFVWYPARYHVELKSIFAMGDMISLLQNEKVAPSDEDVVDEVQEQKYFPMDVCLLEEPEHLNWFRAPGQGWTQSFNYVVGIVHTNYKEYAASSSGLINGVWTSPALAMVSAAMVRAYCHTVIKLSPVLQTFSEGKERTSNVHGVRASFIQEGSRRASEVSGASEGESKNGVYFIGKLLWAKGLDLMLDLQDYYKSLTGEYFEIDVFGSGPDQTAIMKAFLGRKAVDSSSTLKQTEEELTTPLDATTTGMDAGTIQAMEPEQQQQKAQEDSQLALSVSRLPATQAVELTLERLQNSAKVQLERIQQTLREVTDTLNEVEVPKSLYELRRQPIPATFPGRVDHGTLTSDYKVFVNPSISEVLCTTTAEALAMGKFVIIPHHPSNTFFLQFPNCLAYRNKLEFVANVRWALTHDPRPLTPELSHLFTWEAATERLISSAAVTYAQAAKQSSDATLDERIAWFHNEISKGSRGDTLRSVLGAGPAALQVEYERQKKEQEAQLQQENETHDNNMELTRTGLSQPPDEVDDGFGAKFRLSALAEAIRFTVANGLLPSIRSRISTALEP